ncbi:MAG: hypothetical protein JRD89_00735 [Deltaproteobacteria bacterium]|nr:hypothetical protein [Deltaproteobacteria bacterium]
MAVYSTGGIVVQAKSAEGTSDISMTPSAGVFEDIPDLSLTLTTGANPVLVICEVAMQSSAAARPVLRVTVDGVAERGSRDYFGTSQHFTHTNIFLKTLSAGSHTFVAQLTDASGGVTYTCNADSNPDWHHRRLIVIELHA